MSNKSKISGGSIKVTTDKGQDDEKKKAQEFGVKAFVIEIDDINDVEIIQDMMMDPLTSYNP